MSFISLQSTWFNECDWPVRTDRSYMFSRTKELKLLKANESGLTCSTWSITVCLQTDQHADIVTPGWIRRGLNQWACHRLKLDITSTNQKLCTLQESALSHKQITKHNQNLITPYFLLTNYAIQWKKCFTSNEGSGWSGKSNKRRHEFGPGMWESTINHGVVKVKLTLQTEVWLQLWQGAC